MSDDTSPLAGFAGTARLFPLPNLVLFPHVMQPLHIFEPRYQQMTGDALATDRLIALVLLQGGWETTYDGAPPIHDVACLGKIVAENRLEDGRFNILLRGLCRIRIDHEMPQAKLYRLARVELLEDVFLAQPLTVRKLRKQLVRKVPAWFPAKGKVLDEFRKLLRGDLPLGTLCDIVAFALPLDIPFKQQLLEELDVEKRAGRLLDYLETHVPPQAAELVDRKFPPEFSVN
jgi:Lon protease-like protein